MRFFYLVAFVFLLGVSLGFTPKKSDNFEESDYTKISLGAKKSTVKRISKRKIIKFLPEEKLDGSAIKVLVVRKRTGKLLMDSIEQNNRAYADINRYERIGQVSSGVNQGQLEIKLTHDIDPTMKPADKPLTLGGKGFSASVFKPIKQDLHFSFNSHIKELPVYEIEKRSLSGHLNSVFEKPQNKKLLVLHDSDSIFGREPEVILEPEPDQLAKQQKISVEIIERIKETDVYFNQNKKVIVSLNLAEKPLDLMHDNHALLKYDYQFLTSSDR
ncbi:MAG: hypothetical protein HOB58_04800 [Nitrospina sp.]|nr:hypothetical protein [Nitrospina sp.]MBT6662459.1 hypothetical protein [Nitrospina sp.]